MTGLESAARVGAGKAERMRRAASAKKPWIDFMEDLRRQTFLFGAYCKETELIRPHCGIPAQSTRIENAGTAPASSSVQSRLRPGLHRMACRIQPSMI